MATFKFCLYICCKCYNLKPSCGLVVASDHYAAGDLVLTAGGADPTADPSAGGAAIDSTSHNRNVAPGPDDDQKIDIVMMDDFFTVNHSRSALGRPLPCANCIFRTIDAADV
jgi:hypothetical protein